MHLPASKLPDVGTTIFTVMSQLAADCGATDLSQGFPDFPAARALLERVSDHLRAGHNQYAPMAGLPALREQIALKTRTLYGHAADPASEITVTSGATSGLYCAIQAFVNAGDEVLVFDPAYDSYDPAVRLAGGRAVHIPLTTPGFRPDWGRVADHLGPRTRMLILNSPHNPTGATLSRDDLDTLAELIRETAVLVLSDEVYEHIIFDGREHASVLRHPELAARSLVVSSFGKTYHTTGWKIGYCIAPAMLMQEFRRVHQFVQFCVVTPMQWALAEHLAADPAHYRDLPKFYERKRDLFGKLLAESRFRFTPAEGTYFQLVDYSEITSEQDVDYAQRLTREFGVGCIPVSVFYARPPAGQRLLRFCFAKEAATLERAGEKLCRL